MPGGCHPHLSWAVHSTLCSVSLSSFAPVSGVGFVCMGIDVDMVVPLCISCTLSRFRSMLGQGHEYVFFDTDCNSALSRP